MMAQAQTEALWPGARPTAAEGEAERGQAAAPDNAEGPAVDLSRLGLVLCFLSAVLTLAGIGSALERIFS
jgi:hypothetical protein